MRILRRVLFVLSCLAALPMMAQAHGYKLGELEIEHPWTRATSSANGVAYLIVDNKGKQDDKLIAATTSIADMPMLHVNYMDGEVMKMRMVDAIPVPAGGKAELKPGSYHIMLMGLKAPLKEGDMVPLTLTFEKAGKIDVQLKVEAAGAAEPAHSH
jgi:copper(I)-binding protein